MKYKVGDKVICIDSTTYPQGSGWDEGKVFIIGAVETSMLDVEQILAEEYSDKGIYSSCVELYDSLGRAIDNIKAEIGL